MTLWINGRRRAQLDGRDRGLQYGDGIFETMKVQGGRIRLLDLHLARLYASCRVLKIALPGAALLRRELECIAGRRGAAILKLVVTRGIGSRGYRPTGKERTNRIASLQTARRATASRGQPVRVRVCRTPLSTNPKLAGLKTLNRLDCVLARAEWQDERIWEGLMRDTNGNWVCGTMSNLFVRRGPVLITPRLDQCGVAGVMRRWVMQHAEALSLRVMERRVSWDDLKSAEEVFMSNAVVGIRSVRSIEWTRKKTLRFSGAQVAERLRALLETQ
jgi:4-amino-4-deoxychorismate lyase